MDTEQRIKQYINKWKSQGYPDDIPDSVPDSLMRLQLAPSYKAIACALLKNDVKLLSLGFTGQKSEWYSVLKSIEIDARNYGKWRTMKLF